ncbi:glycosyltransferase family 2 protein [Mucilaginibacter sp. UR6-11]|uniref:glycosyltransferase family 2 protein n=1 Tax=Mucilaginibacter sp. UR6-11 TaxID=1435644 RepID=UPI001E53B9A2|nr:glycosyltransferase family 2 protein [Mucilaginibacter sp. UR6-11]MCC8424346.1 glycosyltransferase [Mucilaginibacter sp. UR6-11]
MLNAAENMVKANTPKISIIIVTYNAAETLQACLDSIYSQKYPALEIVVIDGQSTDGTVKILAENNDRLAYWKSEKDAGIYDAMNKGIKHITGGWIYFLGADDVLFEDFTNLAYELKDETTIYYGRVMTLGGPTIPVNEYGFAKYGLCHQAMIYPKAVFDNYQFNTRYPISADYALNMELYNSGAFRFEFRDHLVANFNQTGVSSTSTDKVFEADRSRLVRKYFGPKLWLRFLFWRFKKNLKKK